MRDQTPAMPAPSVRDAVRLPQWAFPLVTVASLLLGATSIVRGTRGVVTIADSDLTNFFFKSADYILRGDPWHMYAVRALGGYPNFNPPLSMFLLAPLLGLARMLGFAANYGEQITFVSLPFIFLVPLMGYLGLRVMSRLYPNAPETLRLLLYAFITLSPLTWQSYSIWYHVEQPLMLCLLLGAGLALQDRREGLAGLLAGLAFLSRTTALIPLIALGVMLLVAREWRPLLKFGGVSALVAGLGFAPFVLFDATDMRYTFLTWRGGAPIGSDSIWTIFSYTGNSHIFSLMDSVAKRLDMYSVMLVVAVAAFFAVRRLGLTIYMRDMWAVLAIAMLATPMLSKQVWPYYYLEPLVFIVIWELSTLQDRVAGVWRWPVLSISFSLVAATLSQYVGLKSVGRLDALVLGVSQTALIALFIWGVWARMRARKPGVDALNGHAVAAAAAPALTPTAAAAGAGQFAWPAQPLAPNAPQPQPDWRAFPPNAPQPGPQPGPSPMPQPNGYGQTPPAPPRGAAQMGPPPWQSRASVPPMGGATPPRGPSVSPGQSGASSPLWPAEPSAQEWRAPTAPPPDPRSNGGPGSNGRPAPDAGADPWRDWPQQR